MSMALALGGDQWLVIRGARELGCAVVLHSVGCGGLHLVQIFVCWLAKSNRGPYSVQLRNAYAVLLLLLLLLLLAIRPLPYPTDILARQRNGTR